MDKKDTLGFLGICRRANKLACGHDLAKETVVKSKSELVLLASDASDGLYREFSFLCTQNGRNIPILKTSFTMEDFALSVGKRVAVLSVTDLGFAQRLKEKFGEELDGHKI